MGPGPRGRLQRRQKSGQRAGTCLLSCLAPAGVTSEGLAWARTSGGVGFMKPLCQYVRAWLRGVCMCVCVCVCVYRRGGWRHIIEEGLYGCVCVCVCTGLRKGRRASLTMQTRRKSPML